MRWTNQVTRMKLALVAVVALASLGAGLVVAETPAERPLMIAMAPTLYPGVPLPMARAAAKTFETVVRDASGVAAKITVMDDTADVASQLYDGRMQLGVMHGIEFAWAQQQYPDLRPLCIAVNRQRELYVHLVVRDDSSVKDFDDLKKKVLALPCSTPEHGRLFLKRWCAKYDVAPAAFFGRVVNHVNLEGALDDVVRGKVNAVVVDGVSLDAYKSVKPSCHARLKIVQKSEMFPAAAIVYREGAVAKALLAQFRQGMLAAHRTEAASTRMQFCRLTGFEPVPVNYQDTLNNIARAYPPPAGHADVAMRDLTSD